MIRGRLYHLPPASSRETPVGKQLNRLPSYLSARATWCTRRAEGPTPMPSFPP